MKIWLEEIKMYSVRSYDILEFFIDFFIICYLGKMMNILFRWDWFYLCLDVCYEGLGLYLFFYNGFFGIIVVVVIWSLELIVCISKDCNVEYFDINWKFLYCIIVVCFYVL